MMKKLLLTLVAVAMCVACAAAEGFEWTEENGLYGVIHTTGALVEPCVWERLEPQGDGWFEGRKTVTFELTDAMAADCDCCREDAD